MDDGWCLLSPCGFARMLHFKFHLHTVPFWKVKVQINSTQFKSTLKTVPGARSEFFLGGGKPCPLGVAWLLLKNGNFGSLGDKNMFKMYKKAGVGRESDIW